MLQLKNIMLSKHYNPVTMSFDIKAVTTVDSR